MQNLLDAALWYAEELGLMVFPCHPNTKIPATGKGGFKHATTDPDQIREWWTVNPNYNIGIWPCKASGVFVLDIDTGKSKGGKDKVGFETLAALEEQYGKLPDTWVVKTGGGGAQYYFKHPGTYVQKSESRIGKDIDVRGDNGYAMAPPSIHDETGNVYEWTKSPLEYALATAPPWVLELNETKTPKEKEPPTKKARKKLIPDGQRYKECTREAGKLRGWGYEEEQIFMNLKFFFYNSCEQLEDDDPEEVENRLRSLARSACESWEPNAKDYELTDMGNADRFVDMFGDVARYCAPWKSWVIWNKHIWERDRHHKVQELAKECVRRIKKEASKLNSQEKMKLWMQWFTKSQSSERLGALVKQARSALKASPEDFDKDPWLFNVLNGTVNLKTGKLEKHDPKNMITRMAPVKYDKSATCPTFRRFINDVMIGDTELTEFVQRFLGYSLTGDTRERVFVVFWGSKGKNGKSTLLERVKDVMGDYAISTRAETLLAKERNGIPNDIARLYGTRFVCANESEEGKKLDEPTIKELAGGEDTVTARFMYGEFFDFRPGFKICLRTNHLPRVSADSQAIWDRIRLVPFNMRVKSEDDPDGTVQEDKSLKEKLQGELDGIFMWCLEGCLMWQREGLKAPEQVRKATGEYRDNEDMTGQFLEDMCTMDPEGSVRAGDMVKVYKIWCNENNYKSCGSQKLKSRLERKGLVSKRGSDGRFWYGTNLTDEARALIVENF